jgi:hypothetical protein
MTPYEQWALADRRARQAESDHAGAVLAVTEAQADPRVGSAAVRSLQQREASLLARSRQAAAARAAADAAFRAAQDKAGVGAAAIKHDTLPAEPPQGWPEDSPWPPPPSTAGG